MKLEQRGVIDSTNAQNFYLWVFIDEERNSTRSDLISSSARTTL